VDGGAGNDYLAGGRRGRYVCLGSRYNNDTVFDSAGGIAEGANIDKVVFTADVAPDDVTLSRPSNGDDLVFTINDTGETLTITNQFHKFVIGPIFNEIEQFRFADGTVWTPDYFRPRLLQRAKTAGNDTIVRISHRRPARWRYRQ